MTSKEYERETCMNKARAYWNRKIAEKDLTITQLIEENMLLRNANENATNLRTVDLFIIDRYKKALEEITKNEKHLGLFGAVTDRIIRISQQALEDK